LALRPYVVRPGDYLLKISVNLGFDADAVWGLAENKPLRDLGRDPNILCPGDVLYVPGDPPPPLSLQTGSLNMFNAPNAPVKVQVRFTERGKPLVNEPYLVEGADVPPGSLDGDGNFQADIVTSVEQLIVRFPNRYEAYTVTVGQLDPITERSGVIQRLAHLGYLPAGVAPTTVDDDTLDVALRTIQRFAQIEETGIVDDATRQELLRRHGS
jgi:hypothetical protein